MKKVTAGIADMGYSGAQVILKKDREPAILEVQQKIMAARTATDNGSKDRNLFGIYFFVFNLRVDPQQLQHLAFLAFVAGKNGAGQELSCKNGAGQKTKQTNPKIKQFKNKIKN